MMIVNAVASCINWIGTNLGFMSSGPVTVDRTDIKCDTTSVTCDSI